MAVTSKEKSSFKQQFTVFLSAFHIPHCTVHLNNIKNNSRPQRETFLKVHKTIKKVKAFLNELRDYLNCILDV